MPSVPCNNDLLAGNYLDDGSRLWLIDWEYSGNNDPAFELGNTAQELEFDDAQVEELCAAYFGNTSPALLARMRLGIDPSVRASSRPSGPPSRPGVSTIDYDFTGWAGERWAAGEGQRSTGRASRRGSRSSSAPDESEWIAGKHSEQGVGRGDTTTTTSSVHSRP